MKKLLVLFVVVVGSLLSGGEVASSPAADGLIDVETIDIGIGTECFRFAIFADPQIVDDSVAHLNKVQDAIDEINSFYPDVEFVVVLGDLIQGEQTTQAAYQGELDAIENKLENGLETALGIPYIPIIGNHDVWFDFDSYPATATAPEYLFANTFATQYGELSTKLVGWIQQTQMPATNPYDLDFPAPHFQNFAFDYGPYRFIALDFVARDDFKKAASGFYGYADLHDVDPNNTPIANATFEWLEGELERSADRGVKNIVFLVHHPPDGIPWYGYSSGDINKLVDLLGQYKTSHGLIYHWFSGHRHVKGLLINRWNIDNLIEVPPTGVTVPSVRNIPPDTTNPGTFAIVNACSYPDWIGWPMFHYDGQNTGVAGSPGAITKPTNLQWTFNTGDIILASPVVGADGTIYAVSTSPSVGGKVYALDAQTGSPKTGWTIFSTADIQIGATPAISPEKLNYNPPTRVYVGTYAGAGPNFFALNPDTGSVIWSLEVPGIITEYGSPTVTIDPCPGPSSGKPVIYVGTGTGALFKIVDLGGSGSYASAAGGWRKNVSMPPVFPSTPALSVDNQTVYVGVSKHDHPDYPLDPCYNSMCTEEPCEDYWGYLVAVDACSTNGDIKWSAKHSTSGAENAVQWASSPAVKIVDDVETVWAGTSDQRMRAVQEINGVPCRKMDCGVGAMVVSTPAIDDIDGDTHVEIIFGSIDGKVYAFSFKPPGGPSYCESAPDWEFNTGGFVLSSAAIAWVPPMMVMKPMVIIGSNSNYIYSIDGRDGTLSGHFGTGGGVVSSPAVAAPFGGMVGISGWVFVGSADGNLYAFTPDWDGDDIVDSFDNCPYDYNPGQEDSDGDGIGDACEGVGGTTEFLADGSDLSLRPAGGSGSSAPLYALLAGAAAAALAIAAGVWYARRRLS